VRITVSTVGMHCATIASCRKAETAGTYLSIAASQHVSRHLVKGKYVPESPREPAQRGLRNSLGCSKEKDTGEIVSAYTTVAMRGWDWPVLFWRI